MPEKAFLLCLRVADASYSQIIPGSTKSPCSVCSHVVYISPESLKVKDNTGAVVLCMQCSLDYLRTQTNGDPLEAFVITKAQVDEASKAQAEKHENIQRN
jgi:hypothetical protein